MNTEKVLKSLLRSYGHNYFKAAQQYLHEKSNKTDGYYERYKEILERNDVKYIEEIKDLFKEK